MSPCRPLAPPTSTKPPPEVTARMAESSVPVTVEAAFWLRMVTSPEVAEASMPKWPLTASEMSTVEPPALDRAVMPVPTAVTEAPVVVVTLTAPAPLVPA